MEKVEIQHGDVILKLAELPREAKRIKFDAINFTVERGEGVNTHDLTDEDLKTAVEVYEKDEVMYFRPTRKVRLTHSEHGTQILEPNKVYKKVNEREFNYEDMEARKTMD